MIIHNISLSFCTEWDESLYLTHDLRPQGCHAVLMLCHSIPWPQDSCFPEQVTVAIAAAFVECGIVAARLFDEARLIKNIEQILPKPRSFIRKLEEKFRHTFPVPVALTRDATAVITFFEGPWSMQYQALLILKPDHEDGRDTILSELQIRREWRDFIWPSSVLALCTPGVDGSVMMIAAETPSKLAYIIDMLKIKFYKSGLHIE